LNVVRRKSLALFSWPQKRASRSVTLEVFHCLVSVRIARSTSLYIVSAFQSDAAGAAS